MIWMHGEVRRLVRRCECRTERARQEEPLTSDCVRAACTAEDNESARGYAEGFELLGAEGWKLLVGCLKEDPNKRISSSAAASSSFCKQ